MSAFSHPSAPLFTAPHFISCTLGSTVYPCTQRPMYPSCRGSRMWAEGGAMPPKASLALSLEALRGGQTPFLFYLGTRRFPVTLPPPQPPPELSPVQLSFLPMQSRLLTCGRTPCRWVASPHGNLTQRRRLVYGGLSHRPHRHGSSPCPKTRHTVCDGERPRFEECRRRVSGRHRSIGKGRKAHRALQQSASRCCHYLWSSLETPVLLARAGDHLPQG